MPGNDDGLKALFYLINRIFQVHISRPLETRSFYIKSTDILHLKAS